MATPPYAVGQEITVGKLYRRIHPDYFDYEAQAPLPQAFLPRRQDGGAVSALLVDYVSEEDARTDYGKVQRFGLCEFNIAPMREATAGAVVVRYNGTRRSLAHVRVSGCDDLAIAAELARLAVVVCPPEQGPAR